MLAVKLNRRRLCGLQYMDGAFAEEMAAAGTLG